MNYFLSRSRTCAQVLQNVKEDKGNFIDEIKNGTTIITGASSGIGKSLAQQVALLGGHVILACRNIYKTDRVVAEINKKCEEEDVKAHVQSIRCDLGSLENVIKFCKEVEEKLQDGLPPLTLLVLNAAIKPYGKKRRITWDGFERTFQINYLSHFLIYQSLVDCLRENGRLGHKGSKVIYVGAQSGMTGPFSVTQVEEAYEIMRKLAKPQYVEPYDADEVYSSSKLCGLMMTKYIHDSEINNKVTSCSVNPGMILGTNLRREQMMSGCMGRVMRLLDNGLDVGTALVFHCCIAGFDELKGLFFDRYDFKQLPDIGSSAESQRILFQTSNMLITAYRKHLEAYEKNEARRVLENPNPFRRNLFEALGFGFLSGLPRINDIQEPTTEANSEIQSDLDANQNDHEDIILDDDEEDILDVDSQIAGGRTEKTPSLEAGHRLEY